MWDIFFAKWVHEPGCGRRHEGLQTFRWPKTYQKVVVLVGRREQLLDLCQLVREVLAALLQLFRGLRQPGDLLSDSGVVGGDPGLVELRQTGVRSELPRDGRLPLLKRGNL